MIKKCCSFVELHFNLVTLYYEIFVTSKHGKQKLLDRFCWHFVWLISGSITLYCIDFINITYCRTKIIFFRKTVQSRTLVICDLSHCIAPGRNIPEINLDLDFEAHLDNIPYFRDFSIFLNGKANPKDVQECPEKKNIFFWEDPAYPSKLSFMCY